MGSKRNAPVGSRGCLLRRPSCLDDCRLDVHGNRRHSFVDRGVKGVNFLHFVREVLGPSLRPGKVVVMDNLRLHKSPEVLDYLQQRQCRVVFVPPYSPDTNPIEMAFSKIARDAPS